MNLPAPGGDHRSRPRRRGTALDDAILEAAIAELDEVGYERLSLERVAERARTGKASVYRRWQGKLPLVTAAVYLLLGEPSEPADAGSLRADLLALFETSARTFEGPAGTALRGLIGDVLRDPIVREQFHTLTRGSSRQTMRELVERARARGELGPGAITPRQLDAGLSVLRFHLLTHGAPVPAAVLAEIVDDVVLPLLRAASVHRATPPHR